MKNHLQGQTGRSAAHETRRAPLLFFLSLRHINPFIARRMKQGRFISLLAETGLTLTVSVSCIQRKPAHIALKESPVSAQLTEMVETRERLTSDPKTDPMLYSETMLAFRYKVYNLVSQALIREPEDLYRAAEVLQFSQDGTDAECCLMAHYLARQAAAKGYLEARRLAAVLLDRYLVYKGLPQKYGTQSITDSLGHLILAPIDPNTTDSERAEWNVLPLEQLKARLTGDTGNKLPNY